jgi:hypothetical protein
MQVLGARRQKDSARKELICLSTETRADVQQTVNHAASSMRRCRILARDNAPAGDTEPVIQPACPDTPRTETRQRRRNQREQNTAATENRERTLREIHRKEDTRRGCFEAKTRTDDDRTRPGGALREKPVRKAAARNPTSRTAAPHREKPKHESCGAPREKTLEEPVAQTE